MVSWLTGDTRKIFVSNIIKIFKTVDESHSARVLIGCKPIISWMQLVTTNIICIN